MTAVAAASPVSPFRQAMADLLPFPGRAAMTWRVALLCALVTGTAMLYGLQEAAISCYLIIYLMKPDALQNIGTAAGLIVLVTLVVAAMVPLIGATIESSALRLLAITLASFVFLYLGAASQLGETGGIIGLVISFVLTLVGLAPAGDVVSFALRYAWYMVVMPMALMIGFNLVVGLSPVRLLRETLLRRLAAAEAFVSGAPGARETLDDLLGADNGALEKQAATAKAVFLVSPAAAGQIATDVRASYRLMLAATALPAGLDGAHRAALVAAIRAARAAIEAGERPPRPAPRDGETSAAEAAMWEALANLAGEPEAVEAAPKEPFLRPDAFRNPDYLHFALKTTLAAVVCYLVYTGLDWQGIHTAMITCYVAALGTTGETVHKLALRIAGCLVGAALGMAAILFVIPRIETVAALMVLTFAGVLVGAWVSTGPERTSYAGVQIALAFLLTVLQGSAPGTSLDAGWDRIVGILLGNVVVYLVFTRIWPISVEGAVRAALATALRTLAGVAALDPRRRAAAIPAVAQVVATTRRAGDLLDLVPFEPEAIRPAAPTARVLRSACADVDALARDVYLARDPLPEVAASLGTIAGDVREAGTGDERLAAGLADIGRRLGSVRTAGAR